MPQSRALKDLPIQLLKRRRKKIQNECLENTN